MSEHAQKKGTTSCDGAGSLRRLAVRQRTPVGVAKSCKTHKTRKVKGGIRNRARSRNTSKALPFCVTTAKSKDSCGGISSVDVVRKGQSVRQGLSEVVRENAPRPQDAPDCNTRADQDIGEMAVASDPISETFSQPQVLPVSPSKEKKRSYAQAELEQGSPNHEVTEDELRRNQGPPKAKTKADLGREPKGATEVELESELKSVGHMCQSNQEENELDRDTLTLIPNANKPEPPVENPVEDLSKVAMKCHPSALRTARCRAQPVAAGGDDNQGAQCEDLVTDAPTKGRYGVISLFDGVSTVMPIRRKKFGYPPVAAILAECDLSLRELVCTEYGYRSDEKWGYTVEGSAVLYLKDVHVVINHNCRLLKELVQMFPDCKWIIVGGSPCQDLTFAGPLRGVLLLVGPSSRLFFVLLCVIYAMQRLVGAEAVRYLVENAASMLQIHLDAFCRLLGLPVDQKGRYVWDPWDFGFQITRRRNYFRNFDDTEEIGSPTQVFDHNYGPLVDQSGNNVPFAPLLRTRESLPYGPLERPADLGRTSCLTSDGSKLFRLLS